MEITHENVLKIEVKGDNVALLKSILSKVQDEEKRIGFNSRLLTSEETTLLNDLNTKLK